MSPKLEAYCYASPLVAIRLSKEEIYSDFILAIQFK